MSREELAGALYVSESLVRSWERGRRVPQPDHLRQVDQIFNTQEVLTGLREELINSADPLEWMEEWREVERQASSLLWFETILVPGLLQTPEYAAAVFQMAKHLGDIDKMLNDRLERQQILAKEDPPTFVVVISEAALLNNVGGAEVMRRQLEYFIEMAQLDNIFLHVVPLMAGVGAGFLAHFIIASLGTGEVAYVDNQLNGDVIEESENVAVLRRMFERFRANALSEPDSIELIRKIMVERWNG